MFESAFTDIFEPTFNKFNIEQLQLFKIFESLKQWGVSNFHLDD